VAVGAGDQAVLAVIEVGFLLTGGVHDGFHLPGHVVLIPGGMTLTVGGAGHVAGEIIGIRLGVFVWFQYADDPAPLFQAVTGAVVVAVHHAHDVAVGIVLQLLGRAAGGLDMDAVARQVIGEGRAGLDGVELLQQPAIPIVNIGL